jgi:nitroreductase
LNVTEAISARRSVPKLSGPAPSDIELAELLETAMCAPDHGRLRPWRLVVVRDDARHLLGAALEKSVVGGAGERCRAAAKPLRAPLLVSIVFAPRHHPHIMEWEQLATTSAVVHNLGLLLHARHWASIWRTGDLLDAHPVREMLGLTPSERLLGWLYVGTADANHRLAPRPAADAYAHLSTLRGDGRIVPALPATASQNAGSPPAVHIGRTR